MNHYEMLCVLPGTLSEEELKPAVDTLDTTVRKYGVEGLTVEHLGKTRLAYPVKHIRYGYFELLHFQLDGTRLGELKGTIERLDQMLRVFVQIYDPLHVASFILAQDPTALSVPPKEDGFERRNYQHGPRNEHRVEKTEAVKEKTEVQTSEPAIQSEDAVVTGEKVTEEAEIKKPVRKSAKSAPISIEDIDQKLDEILKQDMDKV